FVDMAATAGFSADGARVVTAEFSKTTVWDAEDGKPVPGVEPVRDVPGQPLKDGDRVLRAVPAGPGLFNIRSPLLVWQSDKDRREWRRPPESSRTARVGFWRDGQTGPV